MTIRPISTATGRFLTDADISRIHLENLSKAQIQSAELIASVRAEYSEAEKNFDSIKKAHQKDSLVIDRIASAREAKEDELLERLRKARVRHNSITCELRKQISAHLTILNKGVELDTDIESWEKNLEEYIEPMRYIEKLSSSLDYTRDQLPQIGKGAIDQLLAVEDASQVTIGHMTAEDIKFTQGELNPAKVIACLGDIDLLDLPYFVIAKGSDGFYLLDGHHRMAAILELNPYISVPVITLMTTVEEAIAYVKGLSDIKTLNLADEEILKKAQAYYDQIYKAFEEKRVNIDILLDARSSLNQITQKLKDGEAN